MRNLIKKILKESDFDWAENIPPQQPIDKEGNILEVGDSVIVDDEWLGMIDKIYYGNGFFTLLVSDQNDDGFRIHPNNVVLDI